MTNATNQLTTRVSDEVKAEFDRQRKELGNGLSTNQFLKFLVLAAQGKTPELDDLGLDSDATEDECHEALVEWLRGK